MYRTLFDFSFTQTVRKVESGGRSESARASPARRILQVRVQRRRMRVSRSWPSQGKCTSITCLPHFPASDRLLQKVSALKPLARRRFVRFWAEKCSEKVEKTALFCLDRLASPLHTAFGLCINIYIILLSTRTAFSAIALPPLKSTGTPP